MSSEPEPRRAPGGLARMPMPMPIRWRLAGGSALLTLVILCAFAAVVGVLTSRQIRSDFSGSVRTAADSLQRKVVLRADPLSHTYNLVGANLEDYVSAEDAKIRVVDFSGNLIAETTGTPNFGPPQTQHAVETRGYRVESRAVRVEPFPGRAYLQYARPLSALRHTVSRVRLLLILGVLGGTALALLAGLAVARRAMAPIAALTASAREIQRTRDPSMRVPVPRADDEVSQLARTLDGMLQALDSARSETEAMLGRQRAFVADASHELRTPLTSVLANLELLAAELDGEQRETAGSALRSTQRMRRLVADLLLLARADAGRRAPHRPTDLADVVVEAAAELEPVADGHEISVEAEPAPVHGARDELHRMALNLMENSVRHTPAGTHVRASVTRRDGEVLLTVCDDGPGIAPELRGRIFDRFVRGLGDSGGGSGLGLSIVQAVAEAHGGQVALEVPQDGRGTRFVVRLPAGAPAEVAAQPQPQAAERLRN